MSNQEARNKEIILMSKAGMHLSAIADEMGLSAAAVRSILKKAGIKTQPRGAGYSAPDVIEDYNAGVTVSDITQKHSISVSTVYQILAENNIPIRKLKYADARQRKLDEAVAMYKGGAKIAVITAETGVHQPTLHQELHNRKVQLRRPRDA